MEPATEETAASGGLWGALLASAQEPDTWLQRLAAAAVAVLVALLFYVLVAVLVRSLRPRLVRRAEQTPGDSAVRMRGAATALSLVGNVLRWVVLAVAGLYVLSAFGVNLLPVLAGVGFLGAAVAFGSQALVRDLVTGLFLLLEGQYAVGEYVSLNGVFGRVAEVGLRVTALDTPDSKRQYFPNGTINTVAVYPRPRLGMELQIPLASAQQAEALQGPLQALLEEARLAFPRELLEAAPPQIYRGGERVHGLRVRLTVRPGQEWVVNEELLGRVRALLVAEAIAPPEGMAPAVRTPPPEAAA